MSINKVQAIKTALILIALTAVGSCGGAADSMAPPEESPPAAPSGAGEGPDLCAGLVQDKRPRAVTPLERPPLRTPITDPAFGTRIVRITDVSPSEGEGAVVKPVYSTTQAWNADESLLLLWHRGAGFELYDGHTYAFRGRMDLESPTDLEQVYWDPVDPDVLYYPSNYKAEPRFMRYRVSQGSSELVRHFGGPPTDCPSGWDYPLSTGADPQDMSWGPERVIGLRCGPTKFLYSIPTNEVLGIFHDQSHTAPAATFDGSLAYHNGRVLDRELKPARTLDVANPYEHSCLGRSASGPVLGAVDFDGSPAGSLIVHDLTTGRKRPIISQATGWPYPPSGTHVSGLVRNGPPGWFAVSVVGDPTDSCLLCQELLLANVDTGTVCRVAHHRSWSHSGHWDYWAEPHVGISPSGTRLVFASDWGGGTTVDTFVVELPAYGPSRAKP